jgi:tetratricopeptide (TPR) repeat protein
LKIFDFRVKIACVLILPCILCFGCGSDPEEERVITPDKDVQRGWDEYESGEYGIAMQSFERAITTDGDHLADAYNGLGWVYLGFSRNAGVNHKNLATALGKFEEAVTRDSANADAWVGKAALLLIRRSSQDDLRDALKAVDKALEGNAEYLYRHDYDSQADLYALKAQCYYYLGELNEAQDEVKRALDVEKYNSVALAMQKLITDH